MPRDIVCDMQVNEQDAANQGFVSEYHGQTFYFCSTDCKQQFDQDPERFGKEKPVGLYTGPYAVPMNGDHLPGPAHS